MSATHFCRQFTVSSITDFFRNCVFTLFLNEIRYARFKSAIKESPHV